MKGHRDLIRRPPSEDDLASDDLIEIEGKIAEVYPGGGAPTPPPPPAVEAAPAAAFPQGLSPEALNALIDHLWDTHGQTFLEDGKATTVEASL